LLPSSYQTIEQAEKSLSYDKPALLALAAGCRQDDPETRRGAWNLLLLAGARLIAGYLMPRRKDGPVEELGDLFKHLAEAIHKKKEPLNFLQWSVRNARRARTAEIRREEETAQALRDSGSLFVAHEGDGHAWAGWAPSSDPLLRKQLIAALGHLTKSQRKILLLDAEDYTSTEIAALLGVSEGGVRVRLAEARKILRSVLALH
jgi:RNA polymerase sigma factor (sigma-70 family)